MNKNMSVKKRLKRYIWPLAVVAGLAALVIFMPGVGKEAFSSTISGFKQMLLVIPPIFVLLGLLDVWIPRETMVRFMGEGSGIKGSALAILLGSAAAGPLYAAFPVAGIFMKKGATFTNVLLFLGAWSTTKVPMVLFELAAMGPLFTFTRLGLSLIGIAVIAVSVNRLTGQNKIAQIYENAREL
jgi:uncharacterized membrane protein YraQ (UPF0718 family)